jgi:hypothetical protein
LQIDKDNLPNIVFKRIKGVSVAAAVYSLFGVGRVRRRGV